MSGADLSGVEHNPQTIWPAGFTVSDTQQPLASPQVETQPEVTQSPEEPKTTDNQQDELTTKRPSVMAKATSSHLRALAQQGYLDERALEYALTIAGYIPIRTAWLRFINYLLLLLGAAFTLSGICEPWPRRIEPAPFHHAPGRKSRSC